MREAGSEQLLAAMREADRWLGGHLTWIETARAIGLRFGRGSAEMQQLKAEWPAVHVVILDQPLAEMAAQLAVEDGLRSLDAIHLAAGLAIAQPGAMFVTWDARLHAAAVRRGLAVLPERL